MKLLQLSRPLLNPWSRPTPTPISILDGSSSVNVQTQPTAQTTISNKPAIPANNYDDKKYNIVMYGVKELEVHQKLLSQPTETSLRLTVRTTQQLTPWHSQQLPI